MSEKLRIAGVLAGFSWAALSLCLIPSCGSDAASSPGGSAGATHMGGAGTSGVGGNTAAGAAGQAPVAGASGMSTQGGAGSGGAGARGNGGASGAAGGNTAGAPGAGAGGQSGTLCEVAATAAQRKAPAFPVTTIPNPAGVLFRFMNNCPMPLWIKSDALGGVTQLPSKGTKDFDVTGSGIHGRVEAYKNAAPGAAGSVPIQFTEMNAQKDQALNVNLTHVDYVGLPVEVSGNASGKDCGVTACYQPLASLLTGCPAELLDTKEGKCHAPNWYCGAHPAEPFCQALMVSAKNTLDTDPDCAVGKGTTFTPNDIFGCGAFFDGHAEHKNGAACCAKVNRNFKDNATKQTRLDNCAFYKEAPYNVYAKWAHQQCPQIYAFAYDDVAEQSGFFVCNKGTEMDVTYCPGDP